MSGLHIFADFGNGRFWHWSTADEINWMATELGQLVANPSGFGEDG
ncbi:MAG: hypothetical protein KC423_12670 [Anaerolineales bacterium]|nr:hypothetical protein [Anaerolineales bacterium]